MANNLDIIETTTEEQSELYAREVHLARVAKYKAEGYKTVMVDGVEQIVPKNAATGEDMFDSVLVARWDTPRLTPDNTYEITRPTDVDIDLTPSPDTPEQL